MAEKSLLIVDGHSYAYRAFFAIPSLSNSRGEPTNAIFGFLKMLRKMVADFKPTHWVVAWDKGLPEARMKLLEAYKAQRKPMPDPLRQQLPQICELLEAMHVISLEHAGCEADDIIATLCHRTGDARVMIASSDKDLMQLVNDRVVMVRMTPKGHMELDREGVRARYGVPPEQMLDLLCLTGDSSDNIPGVAGIGEKTAAALLKEFGSVNALLSRTSEVKNPRLRAALESARELIENNRALMALNTGVPVTVEWEQFRRVEPDYSRLMTLFEQFGFKTLLEEARQLAQQAPQGQLPLD